MVIIAVSPESGTESAVYIGAPNSGTKALPLRIQSPQLRPTGFSAYAEGPRSTASADGFFQATNRHGRT